MMDALLKIDIELLPSGWFLAGAEAPGGKQQLSTHTTSRRLPRARAQAVKASFT